MDWELDPRTPNGSDGARSLPAISASASDPLLSDRLSLSFTVDNPTPSDLLYTVQSSSDLVNWTNIATKTGAGAWTWLGAAPSRIVITPDGTRSLVQIGDLTPAAGNPQRMMRLQVTTNP